MKYSIKNRINQIDKSVLKIDIDFEPINHPLSACFTQIKITNYPKFIECIIKSKNYGEEFVQIMSYDEMDWEDKARAKSVKGSDLVERDMFLIHDTMGKTIIKNRLFDRILYDYGSKILELHKDNETLPKSWRLLMEKYLEKLKDKIDKESLST
jgi:hypothetical protein